MALSDLFKPKWKHSDPSVRLQTIENISDQSVLAFIAKNDTEQSVRYTALQNLTDQEVLAEIALNEKDN